MLLRQTWQAADKGRLKARRGYFVSITRPRARMNRILRAHKKGKTFTRPGV
nr:MAG TPA: hypothetical protein [Caudoviricetes sp.]